MTGFVLPRELEADAPPEERGIARDEVRMLVSCGSGERILHRSFRDLPGLLAPGDVVVLNTSGTQTASLVATRSDGSRFRLHVSTRLPGGEWVVELRLPAGPASDPWFGARQGETYLLPAGAWAVLRRPFASRPAGGVRLWRATLHLDRPLPEFLERFGQPIRYGYVREPWPVHAYRTVFATEPGSAEMPSAGRPVTRSLLRRLHRRGVEVVPLVLHTGVASAEADERPYPEWYRVPAATAAAVNRAHARGGRVVAVGTTVVRALETVTDEAGLSHGGEGWTDLVITPGRGVRAVDALVTGMHEPRSSHLHMLEAIGGSEQIDRAYREALRERYLWHEFGDTHVLFTRCRPDLSWAG